MQNPTETFKTQLGSIEFDQSVPTKIIQEIEKILKKHNSIKNFLNTEIYFKDLEEIKKIFRDQKIEENTPFIYKYGTEGLFGNPDKTDIIVINYKQEENNISPELQLEKQLEIFIKALMHDVLHNNKNFFPTKVWNLANKLNLNWLKKRANEIIDLHALETRRLLIPDSAFFHYNNKKIGKKLFKIFPDFEIQAIDNWLENENKWNIGQDESARIENIKKLKERKAQIENEQK